MRPSGHLQREPWEEASGGNGLQPQPPLAGGSVGESCFLLKLDVRKAGRGCALAQPVLGEEVAEPRRWPSSTFRHCLSR